MLPILAGAVAGGALLNYIGARQTNDMTRDMAHNANAINVEEAARNRAFQQASADKEMKFQAAQVKQQMAFQERMSSTAMQRQMKDLKKAGLNPMLAAMNGSGASTPSGSAGGGASASGDAATATAGGQLHNALGAFASTARDMIDMAKTQSEIGLVEAQTKKAHTDEHVARKGIPQADILNEMYDVIRPAVRGIKEMIQSVPTKSNKKKWFDESKKPKQILPGGIIP